METETSLTEVATELYQEQYTADPRSERVVEYDAPTVERVYEERQEAAEVMPADDVPDKRAETTDTDEPLHTDAVWSTQDVATFSLLQQESASFQHDMAILGQLRNADLNQLANGDTAKAAALKVQIDQAEQELRRRYVALSQAASELQQKARGKELEQAQKKLKAEWKKLAASKPDYDTDANRKFLEGRGFTRAEIAMVSDHRLAALVDDARLYDAGKSKQKGKGIIPTRKARQQPPADPAHQAALAQAANGEGLRENASRLLGKPKQPAPRANVAELKRRLKQSGSIDDAYAILRAGKGA